MIFQNGMSLKSFTTMVRRSGKNFDIGAFIVFSGFMSTNFTQAKEYYISPNITYMGINYGDNSQYVSSTSVNSWILDVLKDSFGIYW